ncbi:MULTISPECIES: SDR family NAD(P)-dependent oxidoreductase [unclassified Mycolicibacterium]|uniref:SDR family NAD(P)-dependent oxidoreductase n=1 Tax=unclassified Mycolicibacterium TaxID=2636767 RepID=UPI0012DDF9C0|nr:MULTISPECIES: SDR family NAD(P)-dependent oxidoreductase [unclassified Mycolicibacterium]MUL80194.1 SDR family NAD(P)-dependent oxidoreductase [Mycolicibacterium sp. CBMA 329]MUL85961.1 SDR family NAD(P)-dependent oxidoreductase [Mycolicibacterium sp. CBMA 331]MUM03016.1 SDR family NAD(P)-dependent oxidoreductase [Mycolicibacterium sp. CBMA 334]MUM26828.1 SDR family NAD(P)-dependent oxidoreductase [Mycolicibacterium sp. CBMA 295]MUM36257.1 SDR family NAD(P)-dependent oxidoreductase [Mycolic
MSTPTAAHVVENLDLSLKTCVITGASSGLGRESARALASAGAHVVLAARNDDAIGKTCDWIRAELPEARLSSVVVDLASLTSVGVAAQQIADAAPVIDVLMNNAGVMFTPFSRTQDGFEMQFGTNHLGHFALTALLQPQFVEGTRIVNLSSEGHRLGDIDLADPNWQHRDYDKFSAYGAAKTANILHAVALDQRLHNRGVRAFAVHPGMVATNLARHMSRADVVAVSGQARSHAIDVLTPEQGAATQVWAAVSTGLDHSAGLYLADCTVRTDAEPYATDPDRAEELWEISESLCATVISSAGR